jgi:LacI family transcriptional regulator
LAGYDDSPIASEYLLKLTTVDEQGVPVGRQAASLLLERIGQHATSAPKNISIAPTLVVRGSTAKAK